jgi:hypothetical protein
MLRITNLKLNIDAAKGTSVSNLWTSDLAGGAS